MDVTGPSTVNGAVPINRPAVMKPVTPAAQTAPISPQDEVEISAAGRALGDLGKSPELRQERIAQIKAAIDDGTYETHEKFDIAMSRLLDRIDSGGV
ncbi:flagellar biosynthesis anti-sigma factor FlgM [Symmachiella dynata]|uniref:Anti-sigma-28 factor, FlgM n=1 Tax=Symmachiella dynata TaxID=2527995 RepID=A0A517ZNL9_9PLAN|nr:flagellar biosynthesis anti-sigma factor FlgM [Symmachiella dynata]QDT48462.1 Anti-sigma-28 factor, FlgM [Symmachiella dynata]QDU44051.1 Anti-sigma-28 factor, FlgM [Symmachiella dynata]|tara:strand:- start:24 stop:314 length:291 start_codon:yes stop_codon:yes gene_type:complete